MSFVPSDLPRLAGAARLSKPGFDIILAVSAARQTGQPTVQLLRADKRRESHQEKLNQLRRLFCGTASQTEQMRPSVVRFLDLSDSANALTETVNGLFTRGFQPMLNSSDLQMNASDKIPPDVETME